MPIPVFPLSSASKRHEKAPVASHHRGVSGFRALRAQRRSRRPAHDKGRIIQFIRIRGQRSNPLVQFCRGHATQGQPVAHDLQTVKASVLDKDPVGVTTGGGHAGHIHAGNIGLHRLRIVYRCLRLPVNRDAEPGEQGVVGAKPVSR